MSGLIKILIFLFSLTSLSCGDYSIEQTVEQEAFCAGDGGKIAIGQTIPPIYWSSCSKSSNRITIEFIWAARKEANLTYYISGLIFKDKEIQELYTANMTYYGYIYSQGWYSNRTVDFSGVLEEDNGIVSLMCYRAKMPKTTIDFYVKEMKCEE